MKRKQFQQKVTQLPLIQKGKHVYDRYQKYLPVVSFVGGFLWDSLTLTRIDRMSDNLILLAYLLLTGTLILLVNRIESGTLRQRFLVKYREYYPLGIQFFLGGLFSSYVVFYFHSASLTRDWIFLGILVILLVANEFLEKRLTNRYLQISLYSLVTLSFFIFFLPVLIHQMGMGIFFLSLFLSLALMGAILAILFRKWKIISLSEFKRLSLLVVSIYFLVIVFYLGNLIPPVPLSLKSGGIYHHVHREGDTYVLRFPRPAWYQFFKQSENPFRYSPGDTVFCFTAIFAPTRLHTRIRHLWQRYDPEQDAWITTDYLGFEILGGREGGYRGYTFKRHVQPGKWRVQVVTTEKKILGRINFRISPAREPVREWKEIRK